jgi:tetratricopeptide (TPR) repeat protein
VQHLRFRDRVLLGTLLPIWLLIFGSYVHLLYHSAYSLPRVFVTPADGSDGYPRIGGIRPESFVVNPGLEVGDRILRVGETDLRGAGYLGFYVAAMTQAGGRPSVEVEYERGGQTGLIDLPLSRIPFRWMWAACLLALMVASVLILLRARQVGQARRLFVLCTGLFYLTAPVSGGSLLTAYAMHVFAFAIGGAWYVFLLRWAVLFPEEIAPSERLSTVWAWPLGALWYAVYSNYLLGGPLPAPWIPIAALTVEAAISAALMGVLTRNYMHAQPIGRRRIKWVLLGTYLGTVVSLGTIALSVISPESWIDDLSMVNALALPTIGAGFLIGIVGYNLFDVDRVISAATAYALAMFALLAVGIGSAAPLSAALHVRLGIDPMLTLLALSIALAALLVPAQRLVRRWVDRRFFKDRLAFREGVGQLLRDLSACASRGDLLQHAGEALVELLQPRNCVVYDHAGSEYVSAFVSGISGTMRVGANEVAARSFADEDLLVAALTRQRGPLARERWSGGYRDKERDVFARATLDALGAVVIVPIQASSGLEAFVCLGAKQTGDVYTSTELTLLAVVGERIGSEINRLAARDSVASADKVATPPRREDAAAISSVESQPAERVAVEGGRTAVAHRVVARSAPFVGRARELAILRAALDDARAGRGRVVLITGDAGVGKSWLAEELANEVRSLGLHVAWGRCYDGAGAPPFFAWAQVLRSCLRAADDERLQPLVNSAAANLVHAVPALRDRVSDLPEDRPDGPETRLRFFDSVARLLEGIGESAPIVVIIDDLHAADQPSLLLFEFLVRQIRQMHVLLIATCRDGSAASEELGGVLVEMAREPGTERIELNGFTVAEIADLLEAHTRVPPKPGLPQALHARTGGSPLFVGEFVRMLAAEKRLHEASDTAHASLAIPATVRTVIRQRLAGLSEACREVLKIAAAAGHIFSVELLRAAMPTDRSEAAKALEEAVAAGILIEAKEATGSYRFAHVVMRDTLYDELSAAARAELHQRLGEAIVRLTNDEALAEISHHFLEACLGGESKSALTDKAIDYTQRAAHHAVAVLAYEEGARLYRLAIAAAVRGGSPDPRRHAALWLGLGEALFRAGDVTVARQAFAEAAALARTLSDPQMFARAVVGSAGRYIEVGMVNAQLCELLEEALVRLPDEDSSLRARLLARLAAELAYSKRPQRAAELCDLAVGMARRVRDPAALSDAFNASQVAGGTQCDPEERLALASEIIEMAEATGDSESVLEMVGWRVDYRLEIGDMRAVDAEIARHARLAERLRQPLYLWLSNMFRAMRALHDGRFDTAEDLANQALAYGQRAQNPNAAQAHAAQLFYMRRAQGRLAELRLPLEAMAAEYPEMPTWRMGLACVYSETGHLPEASALLDELAADDFASVPQDRAWLTGMSLLAEVAAGVNDAANATKLYALLLPFDGRNVSVTGGSVSVGPVSYYLGLLAATAGRDDDAEKHFRDALVTSARMAAGPNIARVQSALAGLLVRRDRAGDREQAVDLLQQARSRSEELGLLRLLEQVVAMLGELREKNPSPADTEVVQPKANRHRATDSVFRREGDYWTIGFAGETCRLRDIKGLHYLASMLRRPGQEFHALELVTQIPRGAEQSAGEPLLDAKAKAAYKRRLCELRAELAEAERINDLGRSEGLRREMDSITEQMSAALGLGGRDRPMGSDAERARQAVTKSIKAALTRIEASNPALAHHLSLHVKTGYLCSYVPDPVQPIAWDV